jgi:hypothetical protein
MSAWHGCNAVTTYVAEGTKLYKRPSDAIKYSHLFESRTLASASFRKESK